MGAVFQSLTSDKQNKCSRCSNSSMIFSVHIEFHFTQLQSDDALKLEHLVILYFGLLLHVFIHDLKHFTFAFCCFCSVFHFYIISCHFFGCPSFGPLMIENCPARDVLNMTTKKQQLFRRGVITQKDTTST